VVGVSTSAVDERVPPSIAAPMALQHLLVMIAGPISSAFLIARGLQLSPAASAQLLSALLLLSGIGTAIQSLGPCRLGARLPFVMLPGGASVVLFIQVARATTPATATGAVLCAGLFMLVVAPLFTRLMRYFPAVVLGSMIVVVGLNLIKITVGLLADTPRGPSSHALGLAGVTVLAVVLGYRFLPGVLRRFSVLIGIAVGTAVAAAGGALGPVAGGPVLAWPKPLPFGVPSFDLLATVPLLLFSVGAMAEATAQTVLNAEAVGAPDDRGRRVTGTIRGDALTSMLAGLFGGPLMVTSGENIGIVRISSVRSRFVTLGTAVALVALSVLAPVARWINAIPAPVVGGAGLVVFAMITALGVRLLRPAALDRDATLMTATLAIAAGVIPIVASGVYQALPPRLGLVLGSGVTMSALVGVLANLVFRADRDSLSAVRTSAD
jgi:xanthine/uracil permease